MQGLVINQYYFETVAMLISYIVQVLTLLMRFTLWRISWMRASLIHA